MQLAYIMSQTAERLDHIEKHLGEARRQLGLVSNGPDLRAKMRASLDLGVELEIIKSDVLRTLDIIGPRDMNQQIADLVSEE